MSACFFWFLPLVFSVGAWAADAQNGALVLRDQGCLECHMVGGQGIGHEPSPTAVELGRRLTPTYTSSALASVLWNHTPAMFEQMATQAVARPDATEAEWQDLFAYLYAFQFFDFPAEYGRGKQVFENKHCVDCHALSKSAPGGGGAPVAEWQQADDPVRLVYQMWNHAAAMNKELANQRQWQELSGRDLLDLTAYVQALQHLARTTHFSLPDPASGERLFAALCERCHQGSDSLAIRLRNKTWMDIGAGMWNHAPRMLAVPAVSAEDMRKILAYVWELQYGGPEGDPERGHKAFNEKRCIVCHQDPSTHAPRSPRPGKTFTGFSMIALGWGQGRQMHARMQKDGVPWPYISPVDFSNLVAYLNSLH